MRPTEGVCFCWARTHYACSAGAVISPCLWLSYFLRWVLPDAAAAPEDRVAVGSAAPEGRRVVETQVLLDADLAVLGSEPNAYAAYATGVRVEYGHLTDEEWRAGRAVVLQHLLGRDHLYASAPAREWWEARADANLTAELASLAG